MVKIVVHIESGLGNQMLSYCELLALKKVNPTAECYIETLVYDIPECNQIINQWNGYELERIFSIKVPNVKEMFSAEQWNGIKKELNQTKFWLKNWNYPVYITQAFSHAGLELKNARGDFEAPGAPKNVNMQEVSREMNLKQSFLRNTSLGNNIDRLLKRIRYNALTEKNKKNMFVSVHESIFTGQFLSLRYACNDIDRIEKEIKESFVFPPFEDTRNVEMAHLLNNCNSIAIHARRGDMLKSISYLYKYGYFKRAVKYIKKHVSNPVFVFFSDTESIDWCRENERIFGLNFNKDRILFVDWNKGSNSFRDMQLMSHCKHAIITNSSFGWWGAYFIKNPNKITISPIQNLGDRTTYQC